MSTPLRRLSKRDIFSILESRFEGERFSKLSQIPDPFVFKGMERASERIVRALKNREKIVVIGDYDVDGVVSCAILKLFFESFHYDLECVIPNRFDDGYGITPEIIERLDANLIITVDNGIVAYEAALLCKQKGIDLIITDHHIPADTLPEAYALINPKQEGCTFPFKEICGANIAWYLAAALKIKTGSQVDLRNYLDMLSIAIVADVMPLIELNRVFVRYGLKEFERHNRPAIKVLLKNLGKNELNSEDISFFIAPRINSAGRMESADTALKFLCAKDASEAQELFEKLEATNKARKETEDFILQESLERLNPNDDILFVYGEAWHEGVVGIVASRLMQRFNKPCVAITTKDGVAKGSGRSVKGFDLHAHFQKRSDLLLKFGGHTGAIGFSLALENLHLLIDSLKTADTNLVQEGAFGRDIIGEVKAQDIDLELLDILASFEPYGEHNPRPVFYAENLQVVECRNIGKENEHKSLLIGDPKNQKTFWALAFRNDDKIKINENISILFTVSKNIYNNKISPKVLIEKVIKV